MSHCKKCQFRFSDDGPAPAFCPRCGAERPPDDLQDRWVSIARLTDLAEVGYFADVLEGDEIPTRVKQHNEFSAVDGSWRAIYILQVPSDRGSQAARHLRETLEQTTDDGEGGGDDWASRSSEPAGSPAATVFWKPVVFVLIAGSLFYTTRQVHRAPAPPTDSLSFWNALTETDRVLTGAPADGQPGCRLRIDRRSRTILLDEDMDGDGQADRVRCFRDGQLIGDIQR